MIGLTPKLNQSFFVYRMKRKEKITEKGFFKEKLCRGLNRKRKEGFLTDLAAAIKKDPMVIVAGYGHGDTSSNPGPDWLHFI